MNHYLKYLISFLFSIISLSYASAQGCSDAGVCSATQQFDSPKEDKLSQYISLTPSIGLGDQKSWVFSSVLSYQLQSKTGWSFGAALPYSTIFGNIGTTQGIGDIILSLNIPILRTENNTFGLLIAGKIATGDANKKIDQNALPMIYQQSSGSHDLISSVNWNHKSWLFAFGYQHAFTTNANEFLNSNFPLDSDASKYHSSAYLKRGDDMMFRFEKRFTGKNKSSFKAGALPIYRIQYDEIKVNGVYEKIENSTGLTLNLYTSWKYRITDKLSTELQLAAPPITREVRADGTTRSFLLSFRIALTL